MTTGSRKPFGNGRVNTRRLETWQIWVLAIAVVYTLWSALFIFRQSHISVDGKRYYCLFDDAMISMRYAWNLAHGNGLVWNPGERIEGYSNLLTILLMTPATRLFSKVNAVLVMQIFGVLVMLITARTSLAIAEQIFYSDQKLLATARVIAFASALIYYPLTFFSLMGMETGILTLLLLTAVLQVLRYGSDHNAWRLVAAVLALALGYLARNDSLLFTGVLALYAFCAIPRTGRAKSAGFWLLLVALYGLVIVGQGVFRYLYYGEWLPNTYYLKLTGMSLTDRLMNGLGFIKQYLFETGIIIAVLVVDALSTHNRYSILALAMFGIALAYQIYIGGDAWPMWRLMAPTMPLMLVVLIRAVRNLLLRLNAAQNKTPASARQSFPTWIVVYVLIFLIANIRFASEQILITQAYLVPMHNYYVDDAVVLNEITTQDATIGVITAGVLPYYTERKAVDFLGKSDRYIAHLAPDISGKTAYSGMYSVPGHNKYDLNYSIKALQPTYIQYYAWGGQNLLAWLPEKYVLVTYKGTSMYLLKDSPDVLWSKLTLETK